MGAERRPLEVSALGAGRPPLTDALATTRHQEQVGFDAAWWSDHFLHWFPPAVWTPDLIPLAAYLPTPHAFLDPVPIMAAAAVQTERIRLGTAVTDAIRRHPAVLAQTFLTMDHISQGRTILGIGVGEAENILPYGLPYDRRASRLIEALEIIRLLWSTSEPVDFAGDFWNLDQAILGATPFGDRPPEIWMAAHRPRVLRAAARHADGWMPVVTDPAEYGRLLGGLRADAVAEGRRGEEITAGLFAWIVVDEDHDAAEQMINSLALRLVAVTAPPELYRAAGAESPLGGDRWGLLHYVPTDFDRRQGIALADAVPPEVTREYYIWGTPDEIVERLAAFRQAGLEHVYLVNVTPLADPTKAATSTALVEDILAGLKHMD